MAKQLSLVFQAEMEAWDTVAEFMHECGHTGAMDRILDWDQTKRMYLRLKELPQYQAAEQRRRENFLARMEKTAKLVDSWPAWMKGTRDESRTTKQG